MVFATRSVPGSLNHAADAVATLACYPASDHQLKVVVAGLGKAVLEVRKDHHESGWQSWVRQSTTPFLLIATGIRSEAKSAAKLLVERKKEHVLHRNCILVLDIEFATPLCLADMDPVRRAVARTLETVALNESLDQDRLVAIAFVPIPGQPSGDGAENPGGEVLGADPGENQEAGVVHDEVELAFPLLYRPADPAITRTGFPC